MNKNESKYFNTATFFDEALIELLNEKDIDYITIKEICDRAGVNRSTFYLHYENINDLVIECLEYINKKFLNVFNENVPDFIDKINTASLDELILINSEYLTPYLNYVKDNKNIFKVTLNNPVVMKSQERFNDLKKYIIYPIMDRFNVPEKKKKYILNFYIYGIMAIIDEWIKDNCNESIDIIEKYILDCIKAYNK